MISTTTATTNTFLCFCFTFGMIYVGGEDGGHLICRHETGGEGGVTAVQPVHVVFKANIVGTLTAGAAAGAAPGAGVRWVANFMFPSVVLTSVSNMMAASVSNVRARQGKTLLLLLLL